jgi:integrase
MRGFARQRTEGGSWTAYWETKDPATGKRRQHTLARDPSTGAPFRTKGAAERYLNGVVGKVAEGRWQPDQALTVRQLIGDHWLPAQRERVRPTTWEQYHGAVESWVLPYLGAVKVNALTPKMVNDWHAQLRSERDLSARSLQMATGFLKAATKYAVETGLVGRDPLVGVRRPRSQSRTMTVWAPEQARTFLVATRGERLFPVWALLLGRGLRRGEVAGLRWRAIDLESGRLTVTTTRVLTDSGKAVESIPKTAAGVRSIDLDPSLVAILRAHWARQAAEKLAAGEAYEDGGWVFCDELGHPYYPGYFSDAWERRIDALGLPSIRLHDARHSCATALLADGTPVKVVSELLGHADPTITLSVYAHVLPGMAKAAGERLSVQLFG